MLLSAQGRAVRPLWRWAYGWALRACCAYLRAGDRRATVYVGGSLGTGQPVYGLADLDIAVVVPDDPRAPGAASAPVRNRWDRLAAAVPVVTRLVDCCVYEEAHLRDAMRDSTITCGLDGPAPHTRTGGAVYHGPASDEDRTRLLERPELYGPTAAWRRVAGTDRLPPDPGRDAQRRRIAAWLELQFLWRLAVELCLQPRRPSAASMCVKLIAEPARQWMWLTAGKRTEGRERTLTEALEHLPDEAPALELALRLQRRLTDSPDPPLEQSLAAFLRLSSRLARRLAADLAGAGTIEVSLRGGGEAELALPHGGWEPARSGESSRLLPLVDWRTMACSALPDETFALISGYPGDPGQLAQAARLVDKGPYVTLTAGGLLIRPFHGGRARLRAVQCELTDPVSFAVADGRAMAAFPDVLGWSARDTAQRGVDEHRAWLRDHPTPVEPSGDHLGRLITAARAALFLESADGAAPELSLSAAATMESLADRLPASGGRFEDAWRAYETFARDWRDPPSAPVIALDQVVRALPAYSRSGG